MESAITIVSLIKRLHLSTRAAVDAAVAPFGISAAQYSALKFMRDDPAITGAALARKLFVTAQTMSRTLAGLEQAGLIERSIDQENPNSLRNQLTPKGAEVVAACRRMVQGVADAVLADLSPYEREQFHGILLRCTEAAEQLATLSPEEAELATNA